MYHKLFGSLIAQNLLQYVLDQNNDCFVTYPCIMRASIFVSGITKYHAEYICQNMMDRESLKSSWMITGLFHLPKVGRLVELCNNNIENNYVWVSFTYNVPRLGKIALPHIIRYQSMLCPLNQGQVTDRDMFQITTTELLN